MRILAIVLILLFMPALGEAKCRHDVFNAKIDAFVRESYLIQIKLDRLRGDGAEYVDGCRYEDVVLREILCISNYCDTVKIFFKAICNMKDAANSDMYTEFSTVLFMHFTSSSGTVKSIRERILLGGDHRLVRLVDEYIELLSIFVDDLEEEMASL